MSCQTTQVRNYQLVAVNLERLLHFLSRYYEAKKVTKDSTEQHINVKSIWLQK